jgi:hypothetical protein
MPIFFIHLANGVHGGREQRTSSIAFETEHPTVAALTEALEERGVVPGHRIGWKNSPGERVITSRVGFALRRSEYSIIEEPQRRRPFVEPEENATYAPRIR